MPDLHYPMEQAAGGETSLLMAIRPDLVALDKAFETLGAEEDGETVIVPAAENIRETLVTVAWTASSCH